MPISENANVIANYNRQLEQLAAKEAALNTLPEGSARTCAQLECKYTREILTKLDTLSQYAVGELDRFRAEIAPAFASLYLVRKAAAEGRTPTAEEIAQQSTALSSNVTFREAVISVNSFEDIENMLNCLPGGPREGHLMGWGDEITSGTPDYEAAFNQLSADMTPEAREEARQTYGQLKAVNDMIKVRDYSRGRTPAQMFRFATDPALAESHRIETETATPVAAWLQAKQANGTYMERLPDYQNTPKAIRRLATGFFEYPDRSDAQAVAEADVRNRALMANICAPAPEGDAHRKNFIVSIVNRMLAIPDADLAPNSTAAAADFYKSHLGEVEGLFEVPNFLDTLGNDGYMLPQNIVNALNHKSQLVQQNLASYRDRFRSASDEHYRVRAMMDDLPSTFICDAAGFSGKSNKIPQEITTSLIVWGASKIQEGIAHPQRTEVNPAYDGKKLDADQMVSLKDPVHPGRLHTILHTIFGAYKPEFEAYKRDLRNARNARSELARRQAIKRAGDAPDLMNVNGPRFRDEEYQAAIGRSADQAVADKDQITAQAKAEYQRKLDDTFSAVEQLSGGAYNRLDYIVIGGRTMRAILTEEYLSNHPDAGFASTAETDAFVRDSLANGHVCDVLLDAQLNNHNVTIYRPDPATGRLILDSTGRPAFRLAMPQNIVELGDSGRTAYTNAMERLTNINFAGSDDTRERLMQSQNCHAAVLQHNAVNMAAMFMPDSPKTRANLTDPALAELNMTREQLERVTTGVYPCTRATLESMVAAKLAADNHMTVEQIFDPNFEPEVKKQAAMEVITLCSKPEPMDQAVVNANKQKLASISYRGQNILSNYVNEKLAGVDLTNPAQLYAPSRTYVTGAASVVFDLDQDADMRLRKEMKSFIAENVIPESADPADQLTEEQKQQTTTAEMNRMRDAALNVGWLKKAYPHTAYAANLVAGCAPAAETKKQEDLLGFEARKNAYTNAMAAGKPMTKAFTFAEAFSFEAIGSLAQNGRGQNALTNAGEAQARLTADDTKSAAKLGVYVLSGGLAKDCKVKQSNDPAVPLKLTVTNESAKTAHPEGRLHHPEVAGVQAPAVH